MSGRSREHIHPVMLNATFYVGITKLQARLECGKSAAILYALNDELFSNRTISKDDRDLLAQRYGRKLKDVIAAGKEDSHLAKLELEKQKRVQYQISRQREAEKAGLAGVAASLKGKWKQWDGHPDLTWRVKAVALAKKYPELEYAKRLIEKEKTCDIISQLPMEKESASGK